MMHQCQSDAKTHNTREIMRQEHSLHPTCSFVQFRWARCSLSFYSENIHVILGCHFFNQMQTRASELRTDVAIIDRGRFHCDDPLSGGAGRCSLVSSWLLLLRDPRGATLPPSERKFWSRTWNRRGHEIFTSYPIRGVRTLRTAKRMWKAADSTVSHCRRRRKWTRDFWDEIRRSWTSRLWFHRAIDRWSYLRLYFRNSHFPFNKFV